MCPSCPDCVNSDNPCQDALGSVAELLGGCVGRADALIGAVECQKSNGSLHFHWFLFIQRVHQYSTMQEIAALLEEAIIESVELKQFLENLCVSTYTDLPKHLSEQEELEKNFPVYSEDTECAGEPVWGDVKLGRIPAFLYEDAQEVQSKIRSQTMAHDAASFKAKFDHAFQYFQSRCQHHIHKIKNGKRIIPNACKSKQNNNECKHGSPWNNLVSPEWMQGPLLICECQYIRC